LTDTSMISKDSLKFEAGYFVYDSLGQTKIRIDTFNLVYHSKEISNNPKGKRNKIKNEARLDSIAKQAKKLHLINSVTNSSAFDLNQPVIISAATPLSKIFNERIKMFRIEDSIVSEIKTTIADSNSLYSFKITYKPEEKISYKIIIPDSTVYDIYGNTNDSTVIKYKTQAEEFYGSLKLNVTNIKCPVILQLLDEKGKEKVIREDILSGNKLIDYEFLYPKTYILKLIVDSNGNGKWDTGNYLKKIQPERVYYYSKIINVRSNWEIELNWDIQY
jgi:hypothetical protein